MNLLILILLSQLYVNSIPNTSIKYLSKQSDCNDYIIEYCKAIDDTSNIIHQFPQFYGGISIFGSSSRRMWKSLNCIEDSSFFCKGITEALTQNELSIRIAGDPEFVGACEYHSYEKWGINLEMTGDQIRDSRSLISNSGFNYVMSLRIIEKLGSNSTNVGQINSEWKELDGKFFNLFKKNLIFVPKDDSAGLILQLSTNEFDYLEGAKFKVLNETTFWFGLNKLKSGIRIRGKNDHIKMLIKTTNVEDVNFCKAPFLTYVILINTKR